MAAQGVVYPIGSPGCTTLDVVMTYVKYLHRRTFLPKVSRANL